MLEHPDTRRITLSDPGPQWLRPVSPEAISRAFECIGTALIALSGWLSRRPFLTAGYRHFRVTVLGATHDKKSFQ